LTEPVFPTAALYKLGDLPDIANLQVLEQALGSLNFQENFVSSCSIRRTTLMTQTGVARYQEGVGSFDEIRQSEPGL
jgi:hypothetical protein